jgi:hypothetical protein
VLVFWELFFITVTFFVVSDHIKGQFELLRVHFNLNVHFIKFTDNLALEICWVGCRYDTVLLGAVHGLVGEQALGWFRFFL